MDDTAKLVVGAAGLAGGVYLLSRLLTPLPRLVLQDFASVKLPPGWAEALAAGGWHALAVKIGYGQTVKSKPAVDAKLDAAEAAGLRRFGSWWTRAQTPTDAIAEGRQVARACKERGCTAILLNAEKHFWGNRESGSGGPFPDVPGRARLLLSTIRDEAPGVTRIWNGYTNKTFTNAAGKKQQGLSAAEMALADVYAPMCYVWDYTANAISTKAHTSQANKWAKVATRWPGIDWGPMGYPGAWSDRSGAWLGTNRAVGNLPGIPELVATHRPQWWFVWHSGANPTVITTPTAASPSFRELGPALHRAYADGGVLV